MFGWICCISLMDTLHDESKPPPTLPVLYHVHFIPSSGCGEKNAHKNVVHGET